MNESSIDEFNDEVTEEGDLDLSETIDESEYSITEDSQDSPTEESDMGLQDKLAKKMNIMLAGKARARKTEKDVFDKNKVLEAVFDKSTVMLLSRLINNGIISYVNGAVGAGKESQMYWAVDPSGQDIAVKIYLVTTSNFKKRYPYLIGDPRFTKIKRGTRSLVELWAKKEFRNLSKSFNSGIPCPEPITVIKNILLMKFVGINGVPSPTLVESEVDYTDYEKTIEIISDLYQKAELVHADLSEYNIFKTENGPVVFDFGSAVDIRHPKTKEFLERDISNITRFFVKRGLTVDNPIDVFERVTK
ncbi:MAG TPA: serine protein kinase RIO [Candidatus Nitrosotalea sp.]|nr:serine protein kinase RIO [Candidatus Nitrosotalea sp.]